MKTPETNFFCPLCGAELAQANGTSINPVDGITLWCPNNVCPAQEVMGHGDNAKQAFEVILAKYQPSSK